MERIIQADLYRYGALTGVIGLLKGLKYPGFRYTYILRKASKYRKLSIGGIFWRLLLRRYTYKYGFQIHPSTQIGEGLYIGHFGSLVINPDAKLGTNCNITNGVTIGQVNTGKLKGVPTIGNKVWIGSNAVIVGKIQIGSNVLIAPNAFVNFDVPDNSVVIGNPGQIHEKDNPTDGNIVYLLPPLQPA